MEQELFSTAEIIAELEHKSKNPRRDVLVIAKRLGFAPVGTRPREGKTKGGNPTMLWSREQRDAILAYNRERHKRSDDNTKAARPAVSAVPSDDSGKKIMPATADAAGQTEAIYHADVNTNGGLTQQLGNLPAEILSLNRWEGTLPNKDPKKDHKIPVGIDGEGHGWSKPEAQKPFAEVEGIKGFVASTEADGGLAFYDFDHALNETGEFINAKAEMWFNLITQGGKFFAEFSQSRRGVHSWAKPTEGKFPKTTGKIYLTEDKTAFIEVFYGTNKFCLPTGNLFRCQPDAPIATDGIADEILHAVSDALAAEKFKEKVTNDATVTKLPKNIKDTAVTKLPTVDTDEYDQWRAVRMLEVIPPSELDYDNWFAVFTACKTVGLSYSTVDSWSRHDTSLNGAGKPRYNERENLAKWNEPVNPNFNIETLHGIAKRFGYEEREAKREWHELRGDREPIKTKQEEDTFVWTQDRIKSCPVNLRLPDDYTFGVDGIEYVIHGKKGDKYIGIALTPIVPTKIFHNPINHDVEYEFSILTALGEWHKVEVPGTVLGDREFIRTLNGKGAQIDAPPHLTKFINAIIKRNADVLPHPKSYNQTGWTSEDFDDFAFPDNGKAVVRREGYDYERIFKPKGDPDAWKKKFVEITAQGGNIARITIGFAAAALCVRPCSLPNIQLHLHGRKSIGKTPLQQFCVSAFGNPAVNALSHTFAASPKMRLETACAFRDLPLICEELESISRKEAEKIPQEIYNYFLGIGGQNLTRDGKKREPKIISGGRLTSGEHSLTQTFGNGGELKRVLELRCSSLLDEDFAADLYPFVERNHGLFLEQWTKYIIEHRHEIKHRYEEELKGLRTVQKALGEESDRTQLVTLVLSAVAYQHFKVCIGLQETVNFMELQNDVTNIAATLPTAEELDDTTRAEAELSSWVASHEKSFTQIRENKDSGEDEEIVQWGTERFGVIFPNGEVAFHPTQLRKILQDELHFTSANKLFNEWNDRGKLITNSGRYDHNIIFVSGGKPYKTIHFKAGIIATSAEDAELKHYQKMGVL